MEKNIEKLLMNKLRQPVHKNYICKYILRDLTQEDCEKQLKKMIDEGLIEESPLASGYFGIKNSN